MLAVRSTTALSDAAIINASVIANGCARWAADAARGQTAMTVAPIKEGIMINRAECDDRKRGEGNSDADSSGEAAAARPTCRKELSATSTSRKKPLYLYNLQVLAHIERA